MSNILIKAEHLSKMYKLGVINNGTLWKDFQTWLALKKGNDDPNSKIDEDRYYGNEDYFWALKDLNFDICEGDRIAVIGKNGAGKSTLLKILSRITSPTEGIIKIRGKIASLLEVGTGFHGELTGRENIYLNGAILGMKKKQIDKKLDEIVAFSEIDHHIDTPVKRYSSGMYVRLAFAVAAHLDSDILIADEVLAVGDASFQKKALGKMNSLSESEGRTILFVSHNMSAVSTLCTTGMLLNEGRVSFYGDLNSTIQEYLGRKQFYSTYWIKKPDYANKLKYLDIEEISLTDQNNEQIMNVVKNTDKIMLRIVFKLLKDIADLTFGFSLFNSNNEIVYRSLSTDIDPHFFKSFKIRTNAEIACEVPIVFLKSGDYQLKIDCSIHCKEWIINPEENNSYGLAFTVVNHEFSNMMLTSALIAPIVKWIKK